MDENAKEESDIPMCPVCGARRVSEKVASATIREDISEIDVQHSKTIDVFECRACLELFVRRAVFYSDDPYVPLDPFDDGFRYSFWPQGKADAKVLKRLNRVLESQGSEALKHLLEETLRAFDQGLVALAAGGVRACFDTILSEYETDGKSLSFAQKLKKLEDAKRILPSEVNILKVILDMGSAVLHRGHLPSREHVAEAISILEAFLTREFVTPQIASEIESAVPKRGKGKDTP